MGSSETHGNLHDENAGMWIASPILVRVCSEYAASTPGVTPALGIDRPILLFTGSSPYCCLRHKIAAAAADGDTVVQRQKLTEPDIPPTSPGSDQVLKVVHNAGHVKSLG